VTRYFSARYTCARMRAILLIAALCAPLFNGCAGLIVPNSTNATTKDTQPPTVSITAPANNAALSGTVTLTATASDDVGVVGVQFRVDSANVGSPVTNLPYSYAVDTTTVSNGAHTITAVASDAAGNASTSAAINVNVNNAGSTAPSISRRSFKILDACERLRARRKPGTAIAASNAMIATTIMISTSVKPACLV